MKLRIFAMLCTAMLYVHTSFAQQMVIIGSDGQLNLVDVSTIDHTMLSLDKSWVTIKNNGIDDFGSNFFSASFSVSLSQDIKLNNDVAIGVCYSKWSKTPTITLDDFIYLGKEYKDYTFTVSPVASGTTYYYRVYVKLAEEVVYGDAVKVTTTGTAPTDNTKIINGHRFIDLGLPSGLLWANCNVGAEGPNDGGNYYAWGETEPKSTYDWSTYKHGTSSSNLTKYNHSDGKTILDQEDDAAYVNWGSPCRMPTNDEVVELFTANNCTWTSRITSSDGSSINGRKVTSLKNGNSIFFPAAGYRIGGDFNDVYGSSGGYWSRTLHWYSDDQALCFGFTSNLTALGDDDRYSGRTIRPVAEP